MNTDQLYIVTIDTKDSVRKARVWAPSEADAREWVHLFKGESILWVGVVEGSRRK